MMSISTTRPKDDVSVLITFPNQLVNVPHSSIYLQVSSNGTQTEVASKSLFASGGVAIGPDGAFYVTNKSIFSGAGELLWIEP